MPRVVIQSLMTQKVQATEARTPLEKSDFTWLIDRTKAH